MIGIVSDDEFLAEIDSLSNSPSGKVILPESPGRDKGDVNVPPSIRAIIGETANVDGRKEALALAGKLGISDSSVSAYANGATSTSSYQDKKDKIANPIARARARISTKSRNVMIRAIDNITEEKLIRSKATELASIAKDLAGVVRVMEGEPDSFGNNGSGKPSIVIFAPSLRREESFDVIDISATEVI